MRTTERTSKIVMCTFSTWEGKFSWSPPTSVGIDNSVGGGGNGGGNIYEADNRKLQNTILSLQGQIKQMAAQAKADKANGSSNGNGNGGGKGGNNNSGNDNGKGMKHKAGKDNGNAGGGGGSGRCVLEDKEETKQRKAEEAKAKQYSCTANFRSFVERGLERPWGREAWDLFPLAYRPPRSSVYRFALRRQQSCPVGRGLCRSWGTRGLGTCSHWPIVHS